MATPQPHASKIILTRHHIGYKYYGELVIRALQAALVFLIAYVVGAEDYGYYITIYSFFSLFMVFTDFGINQILIRDVQQWPDKISRLVMTWAGYKIVMFSAYAIISLMVAYLINWNKSETEFLFPAFLVFITATAFDNGLQLFYATSNLKIEAWLKIIFRALVVGIGIIILFFTKDLISVLNVYIVVFGIGTVVTVFLFLFYSKKDNYQPIDWKYGWNQLLLPGLPLALQIIFLFLLMKVDILMLRQFNITTQEIGAYGLATKVIELVHLIPTLLIAGLNPTLNQTLSNQQLDTYKFYNSTALKLILIFSFCIIIGLMSTGSDLFNLIIDQTYTGFQSSLFILSVSLPVLGLNLILLNTGLLFKKQIFNMWATIGAVVINIGLNLIFIPLYGIEGAAWATVFAEVAQLIVISIFLVFSNIQSFSFKQTGLFVIPILVLVILQVGLGFIFPPWVSFILAFFILLILIGYGLGFTKSEQSNILKPFFNLLG